MLRGSTLLICNSEYTRRLILGFEPTLADRVIVVYNGIECPPEPGPGPSLGGSPLRISCVARIHPKKGHSVMVEALVLATEAGRDWELHCYGDALPEHEALFESLRRRVAEAGLAERVVWHGFVDGDARYDADVAVVPSVWPEEFSLVCAEAQALGLPVVATGPGGPSEVLEVGVTGDVVPPRDPDALYRALARLDDDRVLARSMGRAGRERMLERFSAARYAADLVAALDGVQPRPAVLVVAPSAELYGSDRSLLNALPELSARFDVTVAFPAAGPAVERAVRAGAHAVIVPDYALRRRSFRPVGFAGWSSRYLRAFATLHRRHRRHRFDMVYSNTLAAGIGPLLAAVWRVPHVIHARECPLEPLWQTRLLLRVAHHTCNLVICNSRYTEGLVLSIEPRLRHRTAVVHNGIELPPAPADSPVRARGPLRISCVGRIHPKKGQSVLLEAAVRAKKEGRSWEIELFGDALPEHQPLLESLYDYVRRHGLESVHFRGFVEGWERYADVDVAVVPSVYPEEFSLVCVEAQAMRLPVVATGPGGPTEVLDDGVTGIVVAPRDPHALYDALACLDDDRPLAAAMGDGGRARSAELFARERYARQVAETLEAVLLQYGRATVVSPQERRRTRQ
jgi:glycosyltransferase involved in cell wall biosynthesis